MHMDVKKGKSVREIRDFFLESDLSVYITLEALKSGPSLLAAD